MKYIVLFRGINVGGKNKIPMAELRACLEELGCKNVVTYIQSGNVVLDSSLGAEELRKKIESILPMQFELGNSIVKVLILTHIEIQKVIDDRPNGFGDEPDKYHSDVIFLMDISVNVAIKVFRPKEGVDKIWPGKGVIYSQRLSAMRTKSRLSSIMASPLYKSMTIRNWNTTRKLLELSEQS